MQTRIRRQSESGKVSSGCLIIVAVVIVVVIGGGYLAYTTVTGMLAEQVKLAVRDNPVVLEHLGNIQEIEFDMSGTMAAGEEEMLVFSVKGSKGSGELMVKLDDEIEDDEKISVRQGSLRMADGQTFDLFPGGAPPADAPKGDVPKEGEPDTAK